MTSRSVEWKTTYLRESFGKYDWKMTLEDTGNDFVSKTYIYIYIYIKCPMHLNKLQEEKEELIKLGFKGQ